MRTTNLSQNARLVTAAELERFPDDDYRYELVEGRLIRMSPVGFQHGKVVVQLAILLGRYVQQRALGIVLTDVGFKLAADPDTVRAPDIAFIRQERIPSVDPRGFWNGAPDLAVEVLSPDDRDSATRAKVDEYLVCGVTVVLVVDPDDKTVNVFRPSAVPIVLERSDDTIEIDEVIAGFRGTLAEVFG